MLHRHLLTHRWKQLSRSVNVGSRLTMGLLLFWGVHLILVSLFFGYFYPERVQEMAPERNPLWIPLFTRLVKRRNHRMVAGLRL